MKVLNTLNKVIVYILNHGILTYLGLILVVYAIGWIGSLGILLLIISNNMGLWAKIKKDKFNGYSNMN